MWLISCLLSWSWWLLFSDAQAADVAGISRLSELCCNCSETCFFASDSDNCLSRSAHTLASLPRLQERRLSLGHKTPPPSARHDPLWLVPIQNERERSRRQITWTTSVWRDLEKCYNIARFGDTITFQYQPDSTERYRTGLYYMEIS